MVTFTDTVHLLTIYNALLYVVPSCREGKRRHLQGRRVSTAAVAAVPHAP